jgi:hypothetical protein
MALTSRGGGWRGVGQGNNETTVRGGPMDADTPNFGLDFGPNTLSIAGNLVRARFQNITAKRFVFDVVHGSLLAVDLGNSLGKVGAAAITTVDADVVITTQRPTSARIWQQSGDMVCATAAAGSLYRDSPCQIVCDFIKPRPPPPPPPPGTVLVEDDFQPCLGKVPRPLVAGCYDETKCTVVATQLCFCKATCEAPYSSVNGVCQVARAARTARVAPPQRRGMAAATLGHGGPHSPHSPRRARWPPATPPGLLRRGSRSRRARQGEAAGGRALAA